MLLLAAAPGLCTAQAVDTDSLNREPLVREAFQHFYVLDYDGALQRFEKIAAQHPDDPLSTCYLLDVHIFKELYRLDLLDTTFYANDGFLTGKHTVVEALPVRDQVRALAQKASDQADARLRVNSNDLDALFARGWARSLEATYVAMVERSFSSALHLALGARGDHQKVLDHDPNYVDAKLVVGTYQYVIGALPLAFKLLIGLAGITGSRAHGMQLLHDCAVHGVITNVEARTELMLFYRREAKYGEAQQIARSLVADYPRGYLFALELANLEKDAGTGMAAVAAYRQVIDTARRPGYYYSPHLELAYFGLGDSLRGQHLYAEAAAAYHTAATEPTTSPELKRRCLLAAGQAYDLMGSRDAARREYQQVLDAGSDTVQGDQARKYLKSAYNGH